MSLFNVLHFDSSCPHCRHEGEMLAEFKFGVVGQYDYRLGEKLRWDGHGVEYVDRPPSGDYDDHGLVSCPSCDGHFWVWISLRSDVLTAVQPSDGPNLSAAEDPANGN